MADRLDEGLAAVVAVLVAVVLISGGGALFAHAALWRPLTIVGLAGSLFLDVLYFNPWFVFIGVVNGAFLVALAWVHWPAASSVGRNGQERGGRRWPCGRRATRTTFEGLRNGCRRSIRGLWIRRGGRSSTPSAGPESRSWSATGSMGGFDAAIETAKVWTGDGFQVVGPSRFGYFRSALPRSANPALQADAFAVLLDALGIERAAVLGFSAGGPPAIQFALRHPERTLSLVLASAHLPTSPYVKLPAALYRAVFSERLFWRLKTLAPGRLGGIMGVPKGFRATPGEWASIRYLMDGLFPIRPRKKGAVLDAVLTNPDVEGYPLEEIAVPALIIHAADDTLAHYETASRAAARIPGARLVTIDRGGHLFAGREAVVRRAIGAFIRTYGAREPADTGAVANTTNVGTGPEGSLVLGGA